MKEVAVFFIYNDKKSCRLLFLMSIIKMFFILLDVQLFFMVKIACMLLIPLAYSVYHVFWQDGIIETFPPKSILAIEREKELV